MRGASLIFAVVLAGCASDGSTSGGGGVLCDSARTLVRAPLEKGAGRTINFQPTVGDKPGSPALAAAIAIPNDEPARTFSDSLRRTSQGMDGLKFIEGLGRCFDARHGFQTTSVLSEEGRYSSTFLETQLQRTVAVRGDRNGGAIAVFQKLDAPPTPAN
jgi:hypothetical protein